MIYSGDSALEFVFLVDVLFGVVVFVVAFSGTAALVSRNEVYQLNCVVY